jgi:VanZ family protein
MKPKIILSLGILMMIIIWMNSLMPANVSSHQSGFFTSIINQFLVFLKIEIETNMLHFFIRKMAHFTEFFILGAIWFSYFVKIKGKQMILKTMMIGFIVALIDEVLQIFVPGRAFAVMDILIDFLGLTCGILFIKMILFNKTKKN